MIPAIVLACIFTADAWDVGGAEGLFDRRLSEVRDTDTRFGMNQFDDPADWEAYAAGLRRRILVSAGLWPMPERSPLNARVFGAIERKDYTVSKVHFEAYPGFLVTGNLYMPKGDGPFPGVLCPHGHWSAGRFEDTPQASVAARAITFARMGIAAFTYDMVGHNDSRQFSKAWGHEWDNLPEDERQRQALWGIHPFGIQLWSSIRALDFLESLSRVDGDNLGCTGASGGGTQTFALSAVDPRVKVAAPVNMISHSMQGGCVCENAPLIRIGASNMEIGALFAPKPLLMVSATGDWTRETPEVEYPAVRSIYDLLGDAASVTNVHVDAPHNFNLESREAVYAHFGKWMLDQPRRYRNWSEPQYEMDQVSDLRLFAPEVQSAKYPDDKALVSSIIAMQQKRADDFLPDDADSAVITRHEILAGLRDAFGFDAYRPLMIRAQERDVISGPGFREERYVLRVDSTDAAIPVVTFVLAEPEYETPVLIVHGEGKSALSSENGEAIGVAREWMAKGRSVALIDVFRTGEMSGERTTGRYSDTFMPTDTAYRVQDVVAAIRWLKTKHNGRVDVVGLGEAGLWCLFAAALEAPGGEVRVDFNGFNPDDDAAWVARHYVPSIRSMGDIATAVGLIAPRRLTISGLDPDYDTRRLPYPEAEFQKFADPKGPRLLILTE